MIDFPQKLDEKIGPTSPFPFLKRALQFILGKEKPDGLTRVFCWWSLLVGVYLTFWYVLGTLTFFLLDLIESKKGVFTRSFIQEKAANYKMSIEGFEQVLFTYHAISGLLSTLMLILLIFVYRQKKWGRMGFIILCILLNAFQVFYISWGYYLNEITTVDKLLNFSVLLTSVLLFIRKFKRSPLVDQEESIREDQSHAE